VRAGDRVQAYSGPDVVEPVLTETRTVEPDPVTIGRGPIERVVAEGHSGVERVTFGAVSKDIIARETLIPAEAAIVRRTPAPGAKVVALTFDDGPWPGQTDAVLAVLDEKDVPATFFMVGARVKAHPEIARRVVRAGHAVGNHTFRHTLLGSAPPGIVRREIRRADQAITRATGVTPRWFRAPAGELSPEVFRELRRDGLRSALWTVDPHDWGEGVKAATIARRVIAAARPGAIILLHDGGGDRRETVRALPRIIDGLRSKGYEFVTLDELGRVRSSW
jgi:peptidoglycan/xylan/chitin deacetylase (PgdA/CDA1 family)